MYSAGNHEHCRPNGRKQFTSRTIASAFQTDLTTMYLHGRSPLVYSQSPLQTRNQLPESEPLSEYSEMPMTLTRVVPTPLQNMSPCMGELQSHRMMLKEIRVGHLSPQVNNLKTDIQSDKVLYHEVNTIPYKKPPPSQFLPPSPQTFFTHYKPDQTFIMQTTSSGLNSKNKNEENKIANFDPVLTKFKDFPKKKTPSGNKFSSVSRKRFFIGSIDQMVRWHKMANQAQFCSIYEVPAILDSISCSPSGVYRMILRSEQNSNTLPLQAVFFPIDRDLPKIETGDLITCVGRMVGTNKLQVFNIWQTGTESLAGLKRTSFLCQRTLQESHSAPEP